MSYAAELAAARAAGAQAAQLLAGVAFQAHASTAKGAPIDLVTEWDRRAEEAIVPLLRAAFPDDAVIGEEEGLRSDGASGRRWYVDPIDGTTNFSHGLPLFAVSIGLVVDGVPAVGVIEAPALGWRFWGGKGLGAFVSRPGVDALRLQTSATAELDRALLVTGFPYDRRTSPDNNFAQFCSLKRQAQGVRRLGAAALDLAMVAAGWFDGYWEKKLKPWDLAAGALLVAEAGGRLSDYSGQPIDVERGELVATNGPLHEVLLAALGRVRPEDAPAP